jgi:hypothetical protein
MERLYVIFIAAICWAIWNVRNKDTFEKHILRSPSEIIFFSISLLLFWAGLQKDADRECLYEGDAKIKRVVSPIFAYGASRVAAPGSGPMMMITGA